MARPVIATARERFDRRWPELRRASGVLAEAAPPEGWLKGLRRLLSMSNRAAAERLGVSHPTLLQLEKGEQLETISLASLRKVAHALDADLVYAIVPRRKLVEQVRARAVAVAEEQVAAIAGTMALEDQAITKAQLRRQVRELAREIEARPRDLW
jgi:predicted DNA-binding mobile mystery protein A